jgi:hypothetical protein
VRRETMAATAFTWGRVLHVFEYDFDGEVLYVTKYHPWKRQGCTVLRGQVDTETIEYHCEETSESAPSLYPLLISWLAYKRLGHNQHGLVPGLCRALCLAD